MIIMASRGRSLLVAEKDLSISLENARASNMRCITCDGSTPNKLRINWGSSFKFVSQWVELELERQEK